MYFKEIKKPISLNLLFFEKKIHKNNIFFRLSQLFPPLICIPDPDLRDQARMHRFTSKTLLLKTFEAVLWRSKSNRAANVKRADEKLRKDTIRDKNVMKSDSLSVVKRCWSYSVKSHSLLDW